MKTMETKERDRVKSLVPAGDPAQIQQLLDDNLFKKKTGQVVTIVKDANEIEFVASTDTIDRDGERVLPKSFDKDIDYYLANPVVLFAHDHHRPAVGKTTDWTSTDKEFLMKVDFAVDENPFARMLWGLYANKYMSATSVGFIPLVVSDDEKDKLEGQEGLTYPRNELIELSLVNVPSNRHAIENLPAAIKGDSKLLDMYSMMIEEQTSTALTTEKAKPKHILSPEELTSTSYVISDNNPLPIKISVHSQDEKEEVHKQMAKEHTCPECEAKANAKQNGKESTVTKGEHLANTLNNLIGDAENKDEIIEAMSNACDRSVQTIEQLLAGEVECPPMDVLEGCAKGLTDAGISVDVDTLVKAAEADGCMYEDEDDAYPDDDDADMKGDKSLKSLLSKTLGTDKTQQKFYGVLSGMFPESYEDRQRAVYADLEQYLEYMLEGIDKYEYVEAYPLATFDDHVIVYCWNTDTIYKAIYTIEDDEVEFTDLREVKLTYQESAIDMKAMLENNDTEPETLELTA